MNEIVGYPPNYDLIKLEVNPPKESFFCWGDTIYNPSGVEIPEDIQYHEQVHTKQQGKDIEGWWTKWIQDKDFRYKEELEAYIAQYSLIKKHYPASAQKMALFDFARSLQELYNIDKPIHQIESDIRHGATD